MGIDASILAPRTRDSGIGRYVRRLIEEMPRLARDDLFVLFAPEACPRPADLPANTVWQALPRLPLGKLSAPATYFWWLPRLARSWRLDVFHAPTVHPRPSWPPVPRRLPCPLVVTIHDLIPLTFYASGPSKLPRTHLAFYRWNLRAAESAAAIITVSEAEK
ncbi:MAG TPA: glycosyltransferase, partial [Dehalococcoidia bacterium]